MMASSNEDMTDRAAVDSRVLRALSADPEISRRRLASAVGMSLGAMNYCINPLVARGLKKVQNFRASNNNLRYACVLTSQWIAAKGRIALQFLRRKVDEYERLQAEIGLSLRKL